MGNWPLVEKLLIRNQGADQVIFDYYVIQYMNILVNKAHVGRGTYTLNKQILDLILRRQIGNYSSLSYLSRVLCSCKTSGQCPQWDQFLARH
jgi:hypothetical protein